MNEPKSRWIPVTERLPELHVDVLCWFVFGEAGVSRRIGENVWKNEWSYETPTHWMPLPDAPLPDAPQKRED